MPASRWLAYAALLAAAVLLCRLPARATDAASAAEAGAGPEDVVVVEDMSLEEAAEVENVQLEADCPNHGMVYMLGIWAGRCEDVGAGSAECMCRTICPVCRAGTPSDKKCREGFGCRDWDITYWRNASATI